MPFRLSLLLLFTFLILSANKSLAQVPATAAKTISPASFKEKAAGARVLLLDVRTPAEFNQGHLPNAVNVNFYEPDFKTKLQSLTRKSGKPVLVYCAVGGRSAKAADALVDLKAAEVYNLAGGFTAWQKADYPVVQPAQ